ncbi:MAG TPA: PEGA domain-containing protein [Polyangiaceae bacterium]|jgi:hypothetical protein
MRSPVAWTRPLVLAATLTGAPLAAHAQAPEAPSAPDDATARAEASTRFKRALELFDEDNFAAALVEFRKAYELTHNSKVLYNVGQVCFQIHDYVCAVDALERYVGEPGAEISPERGADVARDLATLKARIGTVTVTTDVPDAAITIDDVARGATPLAGPVRLNAGRHRIVAAKAGMVPAVRAVDVAGADAVQVSLVLTPLAPPTPPVADAPPKPEPPSRWTALSFVGLGSAAALGVGAAVTGAVALQKSNALSNARYVVTPDAAAASLRSQAKTYALASDLLTAAAVVTLGTTLTWTLTHRPAAPAALALAVGPASVSLRGSFQ